MKKIILTSVLATVSLAGFADNGGYVNGPLTQVASNSPQPTAAKTTGLGQQQLPAPGSLQFKGQLGGAPIASVNSGQPLNHDNLPPVVEAQNSIVPGQVQEQQAAPASQVNTATENSLPATTGSVATNGHLAAVDPRDPLPKRVARLEQKMANLTRMNLPQQMDNLQTQLQQLNGQLQVQEHDIKLLGEQQRTFYKDLDQRIKEVSNGNGGSNGSNSASSMIKNDLRTSTMAMKESNMYKSAFDLLLKRQYAKAQDQLLKYVATYPNGQFVVNAHYWLGEVYLIQNKLDKAKTEFNTVIALAPKSPRVPDARFKIATIHMKKGKVNLAQSEFSLIKKKFPGTTAAQLASIQLKQISIK